MNQSVQNFIKIRASESRCGFSLTTGGRVLFEEKVISAADPLIITYGSDGTTSSAENISLFPPSPSGRYRIIPACNYLGCGVLLIVDSKDNISKRIAIGKLRQIDWIQWTEDERFALLITEGGCHYMSVIDMASYTQSWYPSDFAPVLFDPESFLWIDSRAFKVRVAKCDPDPAYGCHEPAFVGDYVDQYFRIGYSGIEMVPFP